MMTCDIQFTLMMIVMYLTGDQFLIQNPNNPPLHLNSMPEEEEEMIQRHKKRHLNSKKI